MFVGAIPPNEQDDSLDYFALMGAKARLVLELRERMAHQRAGNAEGEAT